ncbi:amidase domain-containing protein, partial [Microbacteriaceae bacterium K1510]|nr:amidase domain-containing protein [Microbacteriaceae bacterium K1510]
FKHFLVRSGYGKVLMRGTFEQVTKPTKQHPKGAIAELQPGDLIAYEWHGGIDHFSVVSARDDNGYLLVNSHTADRYHVPWDMGWDKT